MNKLLSIKEMGFIVTWKLIHIGYFGHESMPIQVDETALFDYLDKCLYSIDNQTDKIIALFYERGNSKVESFLYEYASKEKTDWNLEFRKWRAFLLKDILDNLPSDALQGQLSLLEFWTSFENTSLTDCPLSFPTKGDSISINKYFTDAMYSVQLKSNREWLAKEVSNIIYLDKLV